LDFKIIEASLVYMPPPFDPLGKKEAYRLLNGGLWYPSMGIKKQLILTFKTLVCSLDFFYTTPILLIAEGYKYLN
jgi:hypothetical protein